MLKNRNYIKSACVSLMILTAAYGAVRVSFSLAQNRDLSTHGEDNTLLDLREWVDAIEADTTEVSDVSYWALVEIFLALRSPSVQNRLFSPNGILSPRAGGQERGTICANFALEEPDKSVVISRLNELVDVELRTEDQAGLRYDVFTYYEECDVRLFLQHESLENFNGMMFGAVIGYSDFCIGWEIVYPYRAVWSDAPNLYRQRTVIC